MDANRFTVHGAGPVHVLMAALVGLALLVPSPVVAAEPAFQPVCWPLQFRGRLVGVPTSVSTRYDTAGFWSCDRPDGARNYYLLFNWSRAAPVVRTVWTQTSAQAKCATDCAVLTTAEANWARQQQAAFASRATVAPSGSAKVRTAVTRQFVATAARVTVGAACRVDRRIPNTNYYSVQGLPNVATSDPNDVVGDLYAVCTRVDPVGVN